jgi:hypothetical protein
MVLLIAGFKNAANFSKNRRNSARSAMSEFKNRRFLEFKFGNFKKIKNMEKLCKKTRSNSKNIDGEFFSNLDSVVG